MIEALALAAVLLLALLLCLSAWRLAAGPPRRRLHRAGRAAAVSLVVIPLVLYGTHRLTKARGFQLFGEIVPRVETTERAVALTFDDGPTPPYTVQLLALLRERGARATFFVVGKEVEKQPALAAAIVRQGHELGNHTYSHRLMMFQPYGFLREEIERTDRLIRASGQRGEIHFRPPYGKKLLLLPLYLSRAGKKNIFIDVEPDSYPEIAASAPRIVEHVLARARPGSIIILHAEKASRAESLKAVPGILDGLRAKGYRFVTVSELLGMRLAPS